MGKNIMNKKIKNNLGRVIATLSLASLAGWAAWADTVIRQGDKATIVSGSSTCSGAYNALAKMTNSAGSVWLTPPANTSTGTFTNASGFAAPFAAKVLVTRKSNLVTWCGTNTVTFSATNSTSYSLAVYVTSATPPPTNGQPMTLQVTWH